LCLNHRCMNTKGHCFPKAIILQAVYFKLRFTLSYRDVEELLSIRGVKVDHSTIQRWVFKFTPMIEERMRRRKKSVGLRWRLDETYIKAIKNNGKPELINIDKSGSNKHAIRVYNKRAFTKIQIRQCKYLNNIVEQDHRFVKRRIVQGLGFKEFESAKRTISGIEVVHMLRKKQIINQEGSMFKSFCRLLA
jgi:putative transposase